MRKDPHFLFISETNVIFTIFRKFSFTFIEKNDGQKTNRKKDRPTKSKKTDRLKDSEIDR